MLLGRPVAALLTMDDGKATDPGAAPYAPEGTSPAGGGASVLAGYPPTPPPPAAAAAPPPAVGGWAPLPPTPPTPRPPAMAGAGTPDDDGTPYASTRAGVRGSPWPPSRPTCGP